MKGRTIAPILVVLGAAGIAGGALPTWWTVAWTHPMLGAQTAELTGRQVAPSLLALALVAVAGIGAVAAARGGWRRLIGILIAVVGGLAIVAAIGAATSRPDAVVRDQNLQVADVLDGSRSLLGPFLSGGGGLFVAAGGLLVVAGAFAGRGMGGRFDRSGAAGIEEASGTTGGPGAADPAGAATAPVDPDDTAAALWKSLDSGVDPTAGATPDPTDDPDVGRSDEPPADPATERPQPGSRH